MCIYMFFVLDNLIVFVLMGMEYQKQKGRKEERQKSKSKFVGVRQRASGKWAAEIKDKSKKIRMWLGTYQTAEEAARAYDEAACILRGSNTRTNFSTTYPTIPTNSPISLKLKNLLDRSSKATSNQSQSENKSTPIFQDDIASLNSTTIQKNLMVMEDKSACSSEGNKSLFWVQNQACDNLYGLDMNMINCSMGLVAPNLLQFDYSWLLPQQGMINHLSTLEDNINVGRQLSGSVYDGMNECCAELKYEYDVNYPLSHLF